MIIYFADRQLNILGQASTELPEGLTVVADRKTEEVETGVNIFECFIPFTDNKRLDAEKYTEVGNYLLRSNGHENEFYTIVEAEIDTEKREIYIYAEDAGMDLLNEIVGEFEAEQAQPITFYLEKYAANSGFEVDVNEAEGLYRKLAFENEETATARLASVAAQFDNCEISFSFAIEGLNVTKKYINIHKRRGKDLGEQLRLNKEISGIVTTKSIANLATALYCEGSIPDNGNERITLEGYNYDDGNFYVDGKTIKSREALERWQRIFGNIAATEINSGHITKLYSYSTVDQATLFNNALAELKQRCEMGVNYEIKIKELPENVKIGDRVNIIDDAGELYLSSRILKLQTSVADREITATLGEHLIKSSGISEKVEELAAQFAANSFSSQRALAVANAANVNAEAAKEQAEVAAGEVAQATEKAEAAKAAADNATEAAATAEAQAKAAEAAVNKVEESISSIEETVTEAKNAADNAKNAADTAEEKAETAKIAAENATAQAGIAETAAGNAQTAANNAQTAAENAISKADEAKGKAEEASSTAQAAKDDAEQAEKDIAEFGKNLETVERTMKADYARKTDLTEATANLETQISQNAAGISLNARKVVTIDETANEAIELLRDAQAAAEEAQGEADTAKAEAEQAEAAYNEAQAAADIAQAEFDKAAAENSEASRVALEAENFLNAAIANLETVQGRADATEAEIAAAQAAVNSAQTAYDNAMQTVSDTASEITYILPQLEEAVATATAAQNVANEAAANAAAAKKAAEIVQGEAQALAVEKASLANIAAAEAQNTADNAKTEAENALNTANEAAEAVNTARATAEVASLQAQQAAADLAAAENALAEILADATATEAEVIAAQAEVERANAAKAEAEASAQKAQQAYTEAVTFAENARTAAENAEIYATDAQTAADEAKAVLEKAAVDVNSLEKRVTTSETSITQNAEEIELRATKEEVTANSKTLAESLIQQVADMIKMTVTDSNGQTAMTQTADGWTFDISSLQDTVNSLAENVKIGDYTYTDESGVQRTEPAIDLCETDTGFKLKITNTRILFTDDTNNLVWIDSTEKTLNTQKVKAEEVQLGGWIWQARNNGRNIGLVWKGAAN